MRIADRRAGAIDPPMEEEVSLSSFRSRAQAKFAGWILVAVFVPISLAASIPFVWMYISSFKLPAEVVSPTITWWPKQFYLDGYAYVWQNTSLLRGYANSVVVSTASVSLSVLTSGLAGFLFAKKNFWGKNVLFVFVLSTLMVPSIAIFIPSFFVYAKLLHLKDTYWSLILPNVFTAFGILITRQYLHSIPNELIDSATVDGAGDWRVFWHIILPLSKSVLAAIAILVFLGVFNEFLWPLVMVDDLDLYTLPLVLRRVNSAQGQHPTRILAAAVLALTPILVFFLVFQRQIVKGISLTGIKG